MKKTLALILVLALTVCMAVPSFAALPTGKDGQTLVGIQVYDYDPDNLTKSVSFTVPMFITLAVAKDLSTPATPKSKILVPAANTYAITNTAAAGSSSIAVTALNVTKDPSSTWTLVETAPAAEKNLKMSLGTGATLVQLAIKNFTADTVGFIAPKDVKPATTSVIAAGVNNTLALAINAEIDAQFTYAKAATVPQFNLAYTLQPVDENGNYVTAASTYVGNVVAEAGYKA
ncbi:MAG: hypothetical protein RR415_14325 [Ruthenibacterium sp.]